MQDDTHDSGLPTRAIHDAYLNLQQAHREYRRARDNDQDTKQPQGVFQDAVLTFFELVRPHLKHESALSDYWAGNVPDYAGWSPDSPQDAAAYVREHGTGIYQVQKHVDTRKIRDEEQKVITDGGIDTFEEWHRFLGLSDSERLVSVKGDDQSGELFVSLLRVAVLPLRDLDHWQARIRKHRKTGDGFMASETSVSTEIEYEPELKLITAKRLLVEAADKLGALSEFDASSPRTEITREDFEKLEEWHQRQVE
ncbi:MAG: hypothetical protein ACOCTH_01360 [Halodesulfurarchaeum sp.]